MKKWLSPVLALLLLLGLASCAKNKNYFNFKYDEYQGAIGMGYLYDNSIKEYSFLDKLHESLEINDKRFYIKYKIAVVLIMVSPRLYLSVMNLE